MKAAAAAVFVSACICACMGVTGGAAAHEIAVPKIDKVTVAAGRVAVRIEYAVDARRSADLRRIYDRDASGSLDDAEGEPLRAWLRLVATRTLEVALDGRRLALTEESAAFEGIDVAGNTAGAASGRELHATFVLGTSLASPIETGRHALVVRDRDRDARVQVPVTIEFVAPLAAVAEAARTGMLDAAGSSLAVPFLAP